MNSIWKKASVVSTYIAMAASVLIFSGCDQYASTETVVSAEADGLVAVQQDGKTHTSYKVAADTAVLLDGKSATIKQLESGDTVHVTSSDRDGAHVATKIVASSKETIEKAEQALPTDLRTDGSDQPPTLLEGISTAEALDTSLHGLPELPADTGELLNSTPTKELEAGQSESSNKRLDNAQEQTLMGRILSLDEEAFKIELAEKRKEELVTVNEDTKYTLDGKEATWEQLMVGQWVSVRTLDPNLALYVDAMSTK